MDYVTTKAFIIKAINYSETSRIYNLFTREEGRLTAIAKGVKRPKSALGGILQLGNLLEIVTVQGKGMDIIIQASILERFSHLSANPKAFMYSGYFMDMIYRTVPEREPLPEVFDLLCFALKGLGTINNEILARYFELQFLNILGYRPDLEHCSKCGKKVTEGFISPLRSGITCKNCGGGYVISPKVLYNLGFLLNRDTTAISRLKIDVETLKMMQRACSHFIDYSFERKLKSADLLKDF